MNGDGFSDVIVGAPGYDNGQTDEGRIFLYLGSAAGLGASAIWTAESDQANAFLGGPVSTAGDVNGDGYSDLIAGAPSYIGVEAEGRAYVYHGSSSGLAASPTWNAEADHPGAQFGISVSTAGDVNGDGYSDTIIGAHAYDNGQSDEGRVFVYHGSTNGLPASSNWSAESDQANAYFGISVSTAGDVNADGYDDVIVGAYGYDNGQVDEGRVYVYHGSPSGLGASAAWTAESDQAGASLGDSVSTAGDVNADGYSDVIVGAPLYDDGQADVGRAFVYHGSATGLATSPAWTAESGQAGALFGEAVSSAGDVNADGYSDVIVGGSSHDNGQTDEGRAYVFHGSQNGLLVSAAWTAESDQAGARFGYSASTAGDVNGDGYSDVIVGAYAHDNGDVDEGRVYVFHGSSTGLSASSAWTAEPDQASAFFGFAVSSAGDVNGDGYSDVIVGAVWYDGGQSDEGRALVYHGSATGLAASPGWTTESDQASALLGNSVASAGDVNGDGYSDVIVGAPYYDNGQGDEGRVSVWLGNGGDGGLVRALQQRPRNGARPLSIVGLTGESGLFRIRCEFARNVAGISWATGTAPEAWLEWEVEPLGVPFDGEGIQRGAPQSLLPPGGTLTFGELVSIDDAAGHARTTKAQSYHWRARVATNSPLFPNTAWFSAPGSNVTEAKLRKPALQFP